MPDPRETPAMQQYYRFKKRYEGCILLFRIGDFYEMFDDDAVTVSKAIGLTLTQRTAGVPMAGMPFHQLETYLRKLTLKGFRVAVCEQLMEASAVKGLVPRAVTRVITPGTLVDESLLETDQRVAVAAIVPADSKNTTSPARVALATIDVSTGDFFVSECLTTSAIDELARRGVRELLYIDTAERTAPAYVRDAASPLNIATLPRAAWHFRPQEALDTLLTHFAVKTLAGFGLS
ncbi:MAG: DNA mismatch repair protein MutS, partial [Phycisphaerales bacterium]